VSDDVWGGMKKSPGCPLLLSKLEVVDAVGDGAAVVSVWLRERGDAAFAYRLFRGYHDAPGPSPALALGIHAVGLSGCMALSLAGAGLAQWGPPQGELNAQTRRVRAELAGLGEAAAARLVSYVWRMAQSMS
jgi:hypothetical protein